MKLTRRDVMAAGMACLAGGGFSPSASSQDVQVLRAVRAELPLLGKGAPKTAAWVFGPGKPPVILKARQGEPFKLRIINELDFDLWLHWFGVRGPSELMTINVPAGANNSFDCVFTPPDAGTFWLGPMADVSRMRDMGLYAMLIVEERETVGGIIDVPLVLDDWKLADDGTIIEGFGDVEEMVGEGRLGNWFTVNGEYRPKLRFEASSALRLRLLNAANIRTMNLLLKGADPLIIALDGQPVKPTHLGATALKLAPGQRADLLLLLHHDVTLALDLFEDVAEIAYLTPGTAAQHLPEVAENFTLPANPTPSVPAADEGRVVPITLEGGLKGGLKSASYQGETLDLRALLEKGLGWAMNGAAGPGGPLLFAAKRGETLVLDFDNQTAFEQPMHIHGHVWRKADDATAGWADTAVIPPKSSLRLQMVADNPGLWAIHSLAAERQDGGLQAAFSVE